MAGPIGRAYARTVANADRLPRPELPEQSADDREVELAKRVRDTPRDAELRGVFFRMLDHALREDPSASAWFASQYGGSFRAYLSYPLHGYLLRVDAAARLLGPTIALGIERLHARAAEVLATTSIAKLFLRPEDFRPFQLLQRLDRSRALLANYGEWRVEGREGDVTIVVRDEYLWLREAWVPAIASIFPALGLPPARVDCELDGPYSGRLRVQW